MIHFRKLRIPDLLIIEPQVFKDGRGFFFESYNQKDFEETVGRDITFIQDNHSKSSQGVLRGLHYQSDPFEQAKLVRVIQGEVWDVAVDIRENSSTYGEWCGEILSAENKKQLWIPEGFAHGFLVTSKEAELCYKTTNFYNPEYEKCIIYNDEVLNIRWPKLECNFLLNNKDLSAKKFSEREF